MNLQVKTLSKREGRVRTGMLLGSTPCERLCKAKREEQFIYKRKREVNLRRSGGTKIWSEGTPCGRIYNATHEVQFLYKAKRAVHLRSSGSTKIWSEGTPCGRI